MARTRLPAMAANMVCMWKPAQSGKTREMQRIIREEDGVKTHLNILICSNNRGLVAQTNARMATDLYDEVSSVEEDGEADDRIEGGVYSWMSGTKKANIDVGSLAWKVWKGDVSMVVCCAHKKRFAHLHKLLTELEEARYTKPVNVWIDEADVSVRYWADESEYSFSKFPWLRQVYVVSATFDAVREYYQRLTIMPFLQTHPECYRGLADCEFVDWAPPAGGAPAYVTEVVNAHPEIAQAGMRLFAPGDIDRASHESIADSLTARGFIVLILNGLKKEFRFPDGRAPVPIAMSFDTELSQVLADAYVEHDMECYPFAVTGQLCLGRGITFQSNGFLFDFAILPDMKVDASAYQCAARVLGNTADFDNGFPVTVYLSASMRGRIERQERIAINTARRVAEEGWLTVGDEEIAEIAGDAPAPVADVLEIKCKVFAVTEESDAALDAARTSMKQWARETDELHDMARKAILGLQLRTILHKDEAGRYMASFGNGWRVRTLTDVSENHRNFGDHWARLSPCYDNGRLVLCLRYMTGRHVPRSV
jgi:hypothetical protein